MAWAALLTLSRRTELIIETGLLFELHEAKTHTALLYSDL